MDKEVLKTAGNYYKACEILKHNAIENEVLFVNMAFACELYFKGYFENCKKIKGKNGHNLKRLYDELNDKEKNTIKEKTCYYIVNGLFKDITYEDLKTIISKKNLDNSEKVIKQIYQNHIFKFNCLIENISECFVKFRYLFEKGEKMNVYITILFAVMNSLYDYRCVIEEY